MVDAPLEKYIYPKNHWFLRSRVKYAYEFQEDAEWMCPDGFIFAGEDFERMVPILYPKTAMGLVSLSVDFVYGLYLPVRNKFVMFLRKFGIAYRPSNYECTVFRWRDLRLGRRPGYVSPFRRDNG